ncbi:hypothetical protein [Pseudomonas phage GP100]|nr:hypothetical protein [Pseudomonas phage GP100]
MAAVSTIVAVAAVAVAAGSMYMSSQEAKAAAKDRKQASQVSQAESAAQRNQNRRQQVREERVRRAQIMQGSQNTGVSQSSGELGATSALGTLISSNVATQSRQQNSSDAIASWNQRAADSDLASQQWSGIGSIAGSVFGVAANMSMASKAPTSVKPTTGGSSFGTAAGNSLFN